MQFYRLQLAALEEPEDRRIGQAAHDLEFADADRSRLHVSAVRIVEGLAALVAQALFARPCARGGSTAQGPAAGFVDRRGKREESK